MEVSGRRKEENSTDHTTDILCDPCRRENDMENAVFYCIVCNEFLCDADAKAHRKAAISKAHELLDRNHMPRQKIGTFEDNLCSFHEGEIMKYYCRSHNKNCCSVCTTKEHKQCKVEYIDDIAKGYEQSSEYKSLIEDMTDLMRRLKSVKQQSVDNKNNLQSLHCEIISEIRKFRVKINSILDSLESVLLEEVNGTLFVDSDAAESTTTNCDTIMAKLQEMTSSIDNLRKYKQERQLVMHSKNARAQVNGFTDEVSKLSDRNKRKNYKFIPDNTIPPLIRSFDSLGRLKITEESTKPKEKDQRAKDTFGADILVPVLNQPVYASNVRDINIEHSTDTKLRCCITGGVMLDQTKVVLADYNNDSVKVVDVINNTVTSCLKLPSSPWGIARVEQDQVVVSCFWRKLVFLKVGKALSIVKQLDLGGYVHGIAYTNNSLLVGFGSPDPCVKVLNLMGKR